jgi:hypothetical protein
LLAISSILRALPILLGSGVLLFFDVLTFSLGSCKCVPGQVITAFLSVITSIFDPLRRASFFLILPRNCPGMGIVESRCPTDPLSSFTRYVVVLNISPQYSIRVDKRCSYCTMNHYAPNLTRYQSMEALRGRQSSFIIFAVLC